MLNNFFKKFEKEGGIPRVGLMYFVAAFVIVSSVITVVEVNFTWLRPFLDDLRQNFVEFQFIQATRATEKINDALINEEKNVEKLAWDAAVFGLDGTGYTTLINKFLKENPSVEEVSLIGISGREESRISRKEFYGKEDYRDFSYLEEFEIPKSGRKYISRVFLSSFSEPLIVISAPVRDIKINEPEAVLRAVIQLRNLWGEPLETKIGKTGRITVIDDKGMVIADQNPARVFKKTNVLHLQTAKDVLLGQFSKGVIYKDDKGIDVVGAGVPITQMRWGVLVEQDLSEIEAPLKGVSTRMYLYLAGSIAVIAVLAWLISVLYAANRELALNHEREQLIDSMKSEFISVAAHQLRTPLSAIKWIFSMLFENEFGKLTEQQKEFVEKGCESTNRMIALVNDLLDVSRIEEGKFGFEFLENNIISAIRETVEQFRKQAEERKVAIVVEVPEENITMVFDFQKIKMVLSNLIDNAVRYTKEAGKVMVSLKNAFSSVEIEIKDSGIGIPKEQQEKVFGKFFRADNVVKMQTEGTGLGLYLVKNIIEQHKGVINFSSEEGVGTTFNIVLPKKPDFS